MLICFFQSQQAANSNSELELCVLDENEASTGLETPTPTRRRIATGGAVSKVNRDSRVDSGSVDLETPLELSPKSPLEVLDEALSSVWWNLWHLRGRELFQLL